MECLSRSLAIAVLVASVVSATSGSGSAPAASRVRAPPPPQVNYAPTIGILSVPIIDSGSPCATLNSAASVSSGSSATYSCFSAFYSRWVESAGARAVILPMDAPLDVLDALLDSVNGVLLTGGSLEQAGLAFDAPYMRAAAHVLDVVERKNANGTFFPLHGTCQGMQVLALLASRNASVLSYGVFDAEDASWPLAISWDGHHSSRIFSADTAPPDVIATLMTENVTVNLHHDGVALGDWLANPRLGDFFILASTNVDRGGKTFASTLEAWEFPITATQWHPERNQYEWRSLGINHGADAIAAMQYMGNHFIGDARRNTQSFSDAALFATYSYFSYPLVNAADAAVSGYQWVVFAEEGKGGEPVTVAARNL